MANTTTGQQLDGDFTTSSSFPSGDGTPGGDFAFDFNVVPGDVNRDNTVNATDFDIVRTLASNTRDTNPSYSAYYDINGDATINATDLTTEEGLSGRLPSAAPVAPSIPSVSLLQGSGHVHQQSLVVLQLAISRPATRSPTR